MIEAGEDPLFVLRRMVIFAAEDVGVADPRALSVATAAVDAFRFIGLPEGLIPMTEAAIYLATAPKTNTAITTYAAAKADVDAHGALRRPEPHPQRADAARQAARLGRRLPVPARLRRPLRPRGVPARRDPRPQVLQAVGLGPRSARSPSAWRSCARKTPPRSARRDPSGGLPSPRPSPASGRGRKQAPVPSPREAAMWERARVRGRRRCRYFAVAVTDAVAQSSVRKGAAGRSAWLRSVCRGIVAPAVADGDRLRDLRVRNDDRAALDARVGRLPDPVDARDQEALGRRAVRRREAARDVGEPDLDRRAVAQRGRERRPGRDDRRARRPASAPPARAAGRPPASRAGGCRCASPMSSVTAIAVRGSRSASACASRSSAHRPLAERRLGGGGLVLEVRELDEQERQLRIVPRRAPAADHRGNRVRYCDARSTLLSPWYQMTPAIGRPANGATIAFHSTVGLLGIVGAEQLGARVPVRDRGLELALDLVGPGPGQRQRRLRARRRGRHPAQVHLRGRPREAAAAEVIEHAHGDHVAPDLHQPPGHLVAPRRRPVLRRLRARGADALAVPVGDVEVVDRAQRQRQLGAAPTPRARSPRGETRSRRRRPARRSPTAAGSPSSPSGRRRRAPSRSSRRGSPGPGGSSSPPRRPASWPARRAAPCRSSRDRAPRPSAPASRSARSASRGVHASAGVPPTDACTMPTATPSARCSSRPKWNAAAEKPTAFAASHACHSPPTLVAGAAAGGFATVNRRSPEQPSAAASAPPLRPLQRELHVRLARGDPDLARPDVAERQRVRAPDLQRVRTARRQRRQRHRPASAPRRPWWSPSPPRWSRSPPRRAPPCRPAAAAGRAGRPCGRRSARRPSLRPSARRQN